MKINPIKQSNTTYFKHNNKPNYTTWTGYCAVIAGVSSVIAANRKNVKLHKNLAYIAGIFTLAHIGIVEYYKSIYKNKTNKVL